MANLLIETLAGDYDPEEFEDEYAEAVQALVEAKLQGGDVKRTKEPAPAAGEVVDLLAALQKSVAAARSARGEEDETAADTADAVDGTVDKKPAKKASTKKAAADKSDKKAAKKPAKKAAARKSA